VWLVWIRGVLRGVCLTKEDVLVDDGLLGKAAEVVGFGRVGRGDMLLYSCPGEVDVK
jgi:hypothetical protein